MVNFNFNIEKGHLAIISAVFVFLVGAGLILADSLSQSYRSLPIHLEYPEYPVNGNPGHSFDNLIPPAGSDCAGKPFTWTGNGWQCRHFTALGIEKCERIIDTYGQETMAATAVNVPEFCRTDFPCSIVATRRDKNEGDKVDDIKMGILFQTSGVDDGNNANKWETFGRGIAGTGNNGAGDTWMIVWGSGAGALGLRDDYSGVESSSTQWTVVDGHTRFGVVIDVCPM